jgi:Mce-associated membrane protein
VRGPGRYPAAPTSAPTTSVPWTRTSGWSWESSTASFAGELARITDALRPLMQQTQATSRGNVLVTGVVAGDERRAVVILFLDQAITNTSTPRPRTDRSRMQVTVVKQGGVWKLDRVEAR